MTTEQVLQAAYDDVISRDAFDGFEEWIDYTSFAMRSEDFDPDRDYLRCCVTDGSEGAWIDIFRYRECEFEYVGTIKTLREGRDVWREMGALAGELSYVANFITPWELQKAEADLTKTANGAKL